MTLQAEYNGNKKELAFYAEYFRSASCYGDLDRIFEIASKEARKNGVAVLDAMHLAAANLARCEVFITGEKATRPMHRTELVKVVCFQSLTD